MVPPPFTRREHEIALALARGLSSRHIAEAMSLSIRTVEGHIYQGIIKVGVWSRSEPATMMQGFSRSPAGRLARAVSSLPM